MQPQQPQPTREQFIQQLFLLEPKDNITSEVEARKKLVAGVDKVVSAIKVSYGSAGSNCIIESELYPYHKIVNDGKAIAESIKLADPVENIGANICKETADKSDQISGDGRKTSMLLLGAILHEGMKAEGTPMEIKRSLDECLPLIHDSIDGQTKPISVNDVATIATVAGENEKLGNMIGDIYKQIGADGIIELDNSNLPDTSYEIIEGVRLLNAGFTYPYMANEDKGRRAVYKNPPILITKQKITNINQIDPVLKYITKEGKNELVIFCEDIDLSVSQALAYIHLQGVEKDGGHLVFKTLVIKAPTLWKDWLFEDFAKITGATIIDQAQGTSLKNIQPRYLGTCEKIITTKDETVVLGTLDISDHIKVLEDLNTDDAKIRIARLKTKTAILKLGANTEVELSYLKGKALDARNAAFMALQGGVVAGGGIALYEASEVLPDTVGGKILKEALKYPHNQIVENLGLKGKTEFAPTIIDPAVVVKNSLKNALSVAATVLTSRVVITKAK